MVVLLLFVVPSLLPSRSHTVSISARLLRPKLRAVNICDLCLVIDVVLYSRSYLVSIYSFVCMCLLES